MRWRSKAFAAVGVLGVTLVAACSSDDGAATSPTEPSPAEVATTVDTDGGGTMTTEASAPAASADTAATSTTSTVEPTTTLPVTASGAEVRAAIESSLSTESGTVVLTERMAELDVFGVAVSVVADGEIIAEFAAGTTPDGAPMAATTILQVGSVSKPVAAIAAMSMVADGVIELDAPIEASLTSYRLAGTDAFDEPVTIGRLLSHTAGTNVDGFLGYPDAQTAPSLVGLLAGEGDTDAVAVVSAPGEGFMYSGGGYQVVEQAMLDASGAASFDDLVRARVFEPAGMVDSFYALDPPDAVVDRVSSGTFDGEALTQGWQRHPEHAAAGLWTTAADLGRMMVAFSASLTGADEALLPQATARQMTTPVAATGDGAVGVGWFLDRSEAPSVYRHNGRNIGYAADVAGTVDGRFAVVVVTNSFPGGTPLAREIIATVAAVQGWSQ